MFFTKTCPIKINLTLRVLGLRGDGYHDIYSLFWRRPSPEILTISPGGAGDVLSVCGVDVEGENIVSRACRRIRSLFGEDALAPLEMKLHKYLPTGSGVGAGSGNAAALIRWFQMSGSGRVLRCSDVSPLGSDVAFLASGFDLA
ncbi:MAG: 4-diphosphocytidyl-2C-methyl-D-erythritol kinase, partial [Synergistaceae bacterium]|nr:4-diphosphocytidyl-2C-methyl-D-erythritol kinase [Synergistaceae bacterium]